MTRFLRIIPASLLSGLLAAVTIGVESATIGDPDVLARAVLAYLIGTTVALAVRSLAAYISRKRCIPEVPQ